MAFFEDFFGERMDDLQILKDRGEKCAFCKLNEINELKYGPLYKRSGLVAHYYCVLFSYRVIQNGADDEGIQGFLVRDIRNELKRVKNIKCDYCSKPSASVYCANSQCEKIFHFPCGIMRKSLHQYKGSFKSYCSEHRPRQKIPLEYLTEAKKNKPKCVICYDDIDCTCETDVLWANCCLKTWYHRDCLQKFALSSGYLFKCAICNNRRQFKQWVEEYGIFVPKQDASWELEPNAFSELQVQYGRCDSANCICPFGREFSSDYQMRQWDIALCKSCGSQGIHPACSNRIVTSNWECDLCKLVRKNLRAKRSRTSARSQSTACNSSQDRLMIEGEDFGNVATSSYSQNIVSEQTVANEDRIIRSRTERKRKRTETQEEEPDLKKTAVEDDQDQEEAPETCVERASTPECPQPSTSEPDVHTEELIDDGGLLEIGNVEEVPNELSEEEEEIIVDGPVVSNVGTSSNDDIEESKRKDQGIVIIDLTLPTPPVDKDEIESVMETYRNIQLSDVRYRVKKEVYVVSDDDDDDGGGGGNGDDKDGGKKDDDCDTKPVDNELEVILHKSNSEARNTSANETRPPRNAATSDAKIVQTGDGQPNVGARRKTETKTAEDGPAKPNEQGDAEVEVVEVPDEESSRRSWGRNENPQSGSSSRGAGPPDEKRKSELLDKYFIIFMEEKRNRERIERLSRDIKKTVLNSGKYAGKHSTSARPKQGEDDEDSHITVSSDSETEHSGRNGFGPGDDDDDVQIIESA